MKRYLFFGDSITFGEGDIIEGGWVKRLEITWNNPDVKLVNKGINGEHLVLFQKRFSQELSEITGKNQDHIIFSYGTNDLAKFNGNYLVSIKRFETIYREIIALTLQKTNSVSICTVLPVSDTSEGVKTWYGFTRRNENVLKYNVVIRNLATEFQLNLIDWYNDFAMLKNELLSEDGLHPNPKGYQWLCDFAGQIIDH